MKNATYMYYAAMAFLFLHYQFQLFKHLGSAISRFIGIQSLTFLSIGLYATWDELHQLSFIHSGHFYSAPSSPLLFRGAPDYTAWILYRSFTPKRTGSCK